MTMLIWDMYSIFVLTLVELHLVIEVMDSNIQGFYSLGQAVVRLLENVSVVTGFVYLSSTEVTTMLKNYTLIMGKVT